MCHHEIIPVGAETGCCWLCGEITFLESRDPPEPEPDDDTDDFPDPEPDEDEDTEDYEEFGSPVGWNLNRRAR